MKLKFYIAAFALATCALYANTEEKGSFIEASRGEITSIFSSCCPTKVEKPTQTPPAPNCGCVSRYDYPHHVEVGGNYTYAWITPQGNSTTQGNLGGAQFLYEYCPLKSVYAAVALNWRIGNTKNGSVSQRSIQDFNVQERCGYTFFSDCCEVRSTFFSGLGARYLPETVTVGATSTNFNYTEFYVPVGCLLEKWFTSIFSLGINFEWMPHIFPTVFIEPLGGAQWSLKYQLNNFFVEMPFKVISSCHRFLLTIAPFFEVWHDGRTTAKAALGLAGPAALALGLPGNTYLFTGVNVNFGAVF